MFEPRQMSRAAAPVTANESTRQNRECGREREGAIKWGKWRGRTD